MSAKKTAKRGKTQKPTSVKPTDKLNIVLLDRDGTLIYDGKPKHRFNLGSQKNWKAKIKFLPTVVEGLKRLRRLPNTKIYMITNQPGVARADLPLLTENRANEVCQYILGQLEKEGVTLDGYFLCPHADDEYIDAHNVPAKSKYVCDCECIKPKLGMVFDALKKDHIHKSHAHIYIIGDRESDVQIAYNVDGTGVLVPFVNSPGEKAQVSLDTVIAKNFVDASNYITKAILKQIVVDYVPTETVSKSMQILRESAVMLLMISLIPFILDDIMLTSVMTIIIAISFYLKTERYDKRVFVSGVVLMIFFEWYFLTTGVEIFLRNSLFGIMPAWLPILWGYGFVAIKRVGRILEQI